MSGRKQKFKVDFNALSCWGGAVVIIGSLFKILHLKGASIMISAGLGTEAVLFFLSGFIPPHKDPEWSRIYPAIDDDYYKTYLKDQDPVHALHQKLDAEEAAKNPKDNKKSKAVKKKEEPAPVVPMVAPKVEVVAEAVSPKEIVSPVHTPLSGSTLTALEGVVASDISSETIKKLEDGLKNFGEKVSQISNVADASLATNEFSSKVKSASDNFENLSVAFKDASTKMAEVATTSVDSLAYKEQVSNLTKNLSALNALYELELQESGTHLKSMTAFYQGMATSMQSLGDTIVDSKVFKEEVSKLARNLSSLNAVYGNMLSAVNQPRN